MDFALLRGWPNVFAARIVNVAVHGALTVEASLRVRGSVWGCEKQLFGPFARGYVTILSPFDWVWVIPW